MKRAFIAWLMFWLMAISNALADDTSVADKEWRALIEPMLGIGERTANVVSDTDDPQLRQELYQEIFSGMSLAYMGLFLGDSAHPDFFPLFSIAHNFGSPNPDNTYYLAPLAGDGIYKISGFRGTVHNVDFQFGMGDWYPRGQGPMSPTFGNHDIDTLHINKKTGAFEVILSKERPKGYKGDWWPLDPRTTYVMVRQISYDWQHEVDGRLAIERLDTPAIKPRPSAQEIAANLKLIASWAENWSTRCAQWILRLRAEGLVNQVKVFDLSTSGGFKTQQYIQGIWDLGPHEALIYETEIPKQCRYWNIVLNDMLWRALDYNNRQTSLNGFQARVDKDGKFRAVVSATDPGVPNWLDTAGYVQGSFFGRWKECSSNPTPTLTKVNVADVRKYLPADTPVVTVAQRDEQLRLRRKAAQLRRRW